MRETFPEVKEFYVFGHNIGGNVAIELAKLNPNSVKGLVLLALSAQNDKNNEIYDVVKSQDKEAYRKILVDY